MAALANLLPKVDLGLRSVQVLISLLFVAFWLWMRSQGFLLPADPAPFGEAQYGSTLFVLGVVSGVAGALVAIAHMVLSCFRPAASGSMVYGGRIAADVIVFGLFLGTRVMLSTIPSQFLPDLLESNNAATVNAFTTIRGASGAGMVLAIVLFVASIALIITQMIVSRRATDDVFGSVSSPAPFVAQPFVGSSTYAASNASHEPLATYAAPPATTSAAGFRPQEAAMYNQPAMAQSNASMGGGDIYGAGSTGIYGLSNHYANPSVSSLGNYPSRNPSVLNVAPLSAIGQTPAQQQSRAPSAAGHHQRGPSTASQTNTNNNNYYPSHQRGPSAASVSASAGHGYQHQRNQPSYSSQTGTPSSPWAGQTVYGQGPYNGPLPPTPNSKLYPPPPAQPTREQQQAFAAHQQQSYQQQQQQSYQQQQQSANVPIGYLPSGTTANRF